MSESPAGLPAEIRPPYRGRFAPSPTGPLHLGSVVAALASFLDARAAQGTWLVRMEDLDPPREVPGAADNILRTLDNLHLRWDEAVVYQSTRRAAYQQALAELDARGLLFCCTCSRQLLAEQTVYPGTCRDKPAGLVTEGAIRCRVSDTVVAFDDLLQGHCSHNLATDVGDFVVLRKDGLFAYQLAVVVDDAWQHITDIVRGCDLLDSTPRQLWLQQQLGLPQPRYAHIPLIVNAEAQKLGKQQLSRAIEVDPPSEVLWQALTLLQQQPSPGLRSEAPDILLQWAITHWRRSALTGLAQLSESSAAR